MTEEDKAKFLPILVELIMEAGDAGFLPKLEGNTTNSFYSYSLNPKNASEFVKWLSKDRIHDTASSDINVLRDNTVEILESMRAVIDHIIKTLESRR